jgi:hypothetical protein
MRYQLFFILLLIGCNTSAQKQTFNLATYIPPAGWKKLAKTELVQFTKQDDSKGTYCSIILYKDIDAAGDAKTNFDHSWDALVKETLGVAAVPEMLAPATENGWEIQSGHASFENEGNQAIALLVTSTGFNKAVNVLILTNTNAYESQVTKFLESITLKKPVVKTAGTVTPPKQQPTQTQTVATGKFKFTTTNFDDGWTGTVQEDWVEVTKGSSKVLLHYPNPNVKYANTDINVECEAAWNVLVAPRYNNIQDYKLGPSVLDYERPYYAEAFLTDKATGKKMFVVLFKKGNTGWIEFITPDKNTFIETFALDISKVDYYSYSEVWGKMVKMSGYNRFAVAASDINGTGKWSDHFSSNTYYANVYTGASAGMSTYSSSQFFEFSAGQKYKWQLIAVNNNYGGATSLVQAKGAGSFKMLNDWQIYFSELEGKPKTYDAYFSCIKGGRILWMNDAKFPGSGIFTGYSKE